MRSHSVLLPALRVTMSTRSESNRFYRIGLYKLSLKPLTAKYEVVGLVMLKQLTLATVSFSMIIR